MILSSQLIALGIEEGPVSIVECLSRLALICFGSMAALKWSMFPSPLVPVVVREKCSLNDAASNMSLLFLTSTDATSRESSALLLSSNDEENNGDPKKSARRASSSPAKF